MTYYAIAKNISLTILLKAYFWWNMVMTILNSYNLLETLSLLVIGGIRDG